MSIFHCRVRRNGTIEGTMGTGGDDFKCSLLFSVPAMSSVVQPLTADDTTAGRFRSWQVLVPLWFATLLFGALPALRLYRRLRRPHPPGLCPACDYDLRATPGRCPECGTTASVSTTG
jgi:hypothetical protein